MKNNFYLLHFSKNTQILSSVTMIAFLSKQWQKNKRRMSVNFIFSLSLLLFSFTLPISTGEYQIFLSSSILLNTEIVSNISIHLSIPNSSTVKKSSLLEINIVFHLLQKSTEYL